LRGAVASAYLLLHGECATDSAFQLLVAALSSQGDVLDAARPEVVSAFHCLLLICFYANRLDGWVVFHSLADRLRPEVPAALELSIAAVADPARTASGALPRIEMGIAALANESDPVAITIAARNGMWVDRLDDCRDALWLTVHRCRQHGAVGEALSLLLMLGIGDWMSGRWDNLDHLLATGLELSAQHQADGRESRRHQLMAINFLQMLVATARGEVKRSLEFADQLEEWSKLKAFGMATCQAHHLRALVELGRGRFDRAYQEASLISPPGTFASHVPWALWIALDLVESAVRSKHWDEAESHVRALRAADIGAISPRLSLQLFACEGTIASEEHFPELFEAALGVPGAQRFPFDYGRVQLLYGERLRRSRGNIRARQHLVAAHDCFQSLGAEPWRMRAQAELRATGRHHARRPATTTALTPQELEIAMLAASGQSNKAIAQRLFLSPRTVGAHLYHIFPKLGVTSRAALRDALLASVPTPARLTDHREDGSHPI
jgi:DNA-binding CsgD family transcriptional regulator